MSSYQEGEEDFPVWVQFCGNLAPFAAIVVFLAPMPTIRQIKKDKTVGSLPLLPYSSMVANCFLWLVYGLLEGEIKIWGTNGIGLFLGGFYANAFIQYTPKKKAPSVTLPGTVEQHVQANLLVMGATLTIVLLSPFTNPASFIGNIAVLFCVAMFGSPLAALKTVLETKSAKSIPLPFTLATVLNCFLWSVFGLLEKKDANIYIPNLLGLAFGLVQVALKLIYGDGTTLKTEDAIGLVA